MRSIRTFRVAVAFVSAGLGIGGAESLSAQVLSQNPENLPGSVARTAVTQDLVAQRAQLEQIIAALDWDASAFRRTFAALDRLIAGDGLWLPEGARPSADTPSGASADECDFDGLPGPCATEEELDETIEFLEDLDFEMHFVNDEFEAEWALFCADYPANCVENSISCADVSQSDSIISRDSGSQVEKDCIMEAGLAVFTTASALHKMAGDIAALNAARTTGVRLAASAVSAKMTGAVIAVGIAYFTVEIAKNCFRRPLARL
jgi:hypothetical protein